jgi:hypothetical protein
MKLGCAGCLGGLALLGLLALSVGGLVGATARMLSAPVEVAVVTAADSSRAQQKLFDLARHARRGQTVTLTEGELNALLARHLVEARGVRLSGLNARLVGDDRLEFIARSPLRQLLDEASLAAVADTLPTAWQARPVQLRVGARVRIDDQGQRHLRVDVDEFAVGRQRLPPAAFSLLVDPATVGLLRWRLPDHIEAVAIEPGRVVVRTAP